MTFSKIAVHTVFGNYRKGLIQHCERSKLHLYLERTKLIENAKNLSLQSVLTDRSILIGQKLVENAKTSKFSKETFWAIFKQCE